MSRKDISINLPETASATEKITVRAQDFENNAPIPDKYSAYYDGTSPALEWSGVPSEAKSVVLMLEDPDAPTSEPFVHWLIINFLPTETSLPENVPNGEKISQFATAQQGANDAGGQGYYGMRPPPGDPPHHYHFQIFALDMTIDLLADFSRTELLDAMNKHVLAKGETVGTYERKAE